MSPEKRPAPSGEPDDGDNGEEPGTDPVPLPLDGTLDLHTFRPADAREVVLDYLAACREARVLDVRIVHGKGKGVLKRIVRGLLCELPWVLDAREGGEGGGGWGATLVRLAPPGETLQGGGAGAAPGGEAGEPGAGPAGGRKE